MIGLLSFVVEWYQIDCSLCLSDLSPSGLPVMLTEAEVDYNKIPEAWVIVAKSLPHKVVRKLAGNGQCLPLCGALMAASLMALKWASIAPVAVGSEEEESQEAPTPKRPRIPDEVAEVGDSKVDD